MNITVGQLRTCIAPFDKLMAADVPAVQAYRISRLKRSIESHARLAVESISKLYERFGDRDGDKIIIPDAKAKNFVAELEPLISEVVTIAAEPLTMADLAGINLSAADIENLGPLVAE